MFMVDYIDEYVFGNPRAGKQKKLGSIQQLQIIQVELDLIYLYPTYPYLLSTIPLPPPPLPIPNIPSLYSYLPSTPASLLHQPAPTRTSPHPLPPSTPNFFISYLPTPQTFPALFLPPSFPDFPPYLSPFHTSLLPITLLPSSPTLYLLPSPPYTYLPPLPYTSYLPLSLHPSLHIHTPHAFFLPLFLLSLNFLPTITPLPYLPTPFPAYYP